MRYVPLTFSGGTSSLGFLTYIAPSKFRVYDRGPYVALAFVQRGPFPSDRYVDKGHKTEGEILSPIRMLNSRRILVRS